MSNTRRADRSRSPSRSVTTIRNQARSLLTEAVARLDSMQMPGPSDAVSTRASTVTPQLRVSATLPQSERLRLFRPATVFTPRPIARRPFSAASQARKRRTHIVRTWTHEFVCLSDTQQSTPPSPLERALLFQAGLGLKSVSFTADSDDSTVFHAELLEAFPKLKNGGGYELLRTSGRGNASLEVIPVPSSGYGVEYVRSVVGQAKAYVRPLQQDLNTDAEEHVTQLTQSCPLEECKSCQEMVPLSVLRDHIAVCGSSTRTPPLSYSPPYSPPNYSPLTAGPNCLAGTAAGSSGSEGPSVSPAACMDEGPSGSGEGPSGSDEGPSRSATCREERVPGSAKATNLASCIKQLREIANFKYPLMDDDWDEVAITSIDVRRSHLIEDVLREARKPRFNSCSVLTVSFVGEAAVDMGGPGREFWRLLVEEVKKTYCVSEKGISFDRNTPALQRSDFRNLGMLTSMSILQGGPGMPIFHSSVYDYMSSKEYNVHSITNEDVPNHYARLLLSQIDNSIDDDQLRSLFDEEMSSVLFDTGFRKPISAITVLDKRNLSSSIKLYYTILRGLPELEQFMEGLGDITGGMIANSPALMKPLFVHQPSSLSKKYLKSALAPRFGSKTQRECEERAYIYFLDFLDECEDGTAIADTGEKADLKHVMIFFSGADAEPPGGFSQQPSLAFSQSSMYPTASTCTLELTIPACYEKYNEFKQAILTGLLSNDGFGAV